MSRPQLLITESERFAAAALLALQRVADVTAADLNRRQLLEQIGDYDAIWIRLRHRIDQQVLDAASHLQWIATATTGLNHIDLQAAQRGGIEVISLRGETEFLRDIRATAEHTLALMFALLRRLPAAVEHVSSGGWNRDLFCGSELYRKTIGIVGLGRLGQLVAGYVTAFGGTVIACDPHITATEVPAGIELVDLDALLAQSDVVSIHVDLNSTTKQFFGARQLAQMRAGSRLINTSRGEVIDEAALLDSLASEHLAGAALDVLSNEQSIGMKDHPLVGYARNHANLIITPHIGGCTSESMARTEVFLANKLCAALQASSQKV